MDGVTFTQLRSNHIFISSQTNYIHVDGTDMKYSYINAAMWSVNTLSTPFNFSHMNFSCHQLASICIILIPEILIIIFVVNFRIYIYESCRQYF